MPPRCQAGDKEESRNESSSTCNSNKEDDGEHPTRTAQLRETSPTQVIQPTPGAPVYVRCDSTGSFVNPLSCDPTRTAAEINATELNLHLGQTVLIREQSPRLLRLLRFCNALLVSWWEPVLFRCWDAVPVTVRRRIQFTLWKLYLPLHKWLLGRRTAIHPDASLEYHALTTIMWGGRFFPVTVPRMRFALRQLTTWQPPQSSSSSSPLARLYRYWNTGTTSTAAAPFHVERICDDTTAVANLDYVPAVQKDHCTVRGIYLHNQQSSQSKNPVNASEDDLYATTTATTTSTEYTLFWLYGGAFLAGDADGNVGPAQRIASAIPHMDVFVPSYRLAPEYDMNDILWDVVLAYRWLCAIHKKKNKRSKIILFGCSSGAALCTRLVQFLAEHERHETLLPSYIECLLRDDHGVVVDMPAGAILASPFCDFTYKPSTGSFHQYARHDLIVNEGVLEAGLPFLDTNMNGQRREHSPVHRSLQNLPPLCVLVSEHETVYDETCLLVNRARAAHVSVTVGLWRYMCHVWLFLNGFVPEGEQAMEFIVDWIRELQNKNNSHQLSRS